jgi:hypothetical protein
MKQINLKWIVGCSLAIALVTLWVAQNRALADGWQVPPLSGDIPSPRYGHTIVEIDGLYYLFGGQTVTVTTSGSLRPLSVSDEIFKFDPNTRRFDKLTPGGNLPPGMSGHAAATVDGKMYVLGGYRSDSTHSNQYVFTPGPDGTWASIDEGQFLHLRQDMSIAVIGTDLYVAGGRSRDGSVVYNDVWRHGHAGWEKLPDMPTAVYGAMLTAYKGSLYAFAGRNRDGDHNQLYEYNPAYGYWDQKVTNDPPPGRAYAVGAQAGNQLWIAGGSGGSIGQRAQVASELQDIWALDLDTFQWTRKPDAPETRSQAAGMLIPYPAAQGLGGLANEFSLFIFGGLSGGVPVSDTVEYYSAATPPPLPTTHLYLPLVVR